VAVILLRHTEVALPPGICYGQTDVPLQEPVEPTFQAVRARLMRLLGASAGHEAGLAPLQRIVTSPLLRAARLAHWLGQALAVPVSADPRWMELNFGAWEGLAWNDVPRAELDHWAAHLDRQAPPGGETRAALQQRVRAALDELHGEVASKPGTVLVVTHGGPIRMALPPSGVDPMSIPLNFGGLTCLRALPPIAQWQLAALNQ
jgi:alpha-ribazole phosphatase